MEQLTFDLPACDSAPARKPHKHGRGARLRIDDLGRECGTCGEYQLWDCFYISRTTTYGHVTICKTCMAAKAAEQTKARRAPQPPKVTPKCSLLICDEDFHCCDLCKRHYGQWCAQGRPEHFTGIPVVKPVERPGLPGEIWRAIPTYEGLYEVSNLGRVWSIPRLLENGKQAGGRLLKGDVSDPRGYVRFGLKRPGERRQTHHQAHRLVLWAFTGENPPELDTRHLDGNPANNRWAPGSTDAEIIANGGNLVYGTASENAHDRVRHGTWVNNNRFVGVTECIHGHKFDEANTYWRPTGGRSCKACARERRAPSSVAAKEAA